MKTHKTAPKKNRAAETEPHGASGPRRVEGECLARTIPLGTPIVHGTEYETTVSPLAKALWLYPIACGRSKCLPGFRMARTQRGTQQHTPMYPLQRGYLLHYVRSGALMHRLQGNTHALGAGAACLMDLREPSEYWTEGGATADLYWVLFDGHNAEDLCNALHLASGPVMERLNAKALLKAFARLFRLMGTRRTGYEPRAWAALTDILSELFAASGMRAGMDPPPMGPSIPEPIRDAVIGMSLTYSQRYTIKQAALTVGLRPQYFSRLFRKHLGAPPIVWLNRHRIKEAEAILASTAEPVHRIGELVGIPNPIYFSRVFRSVAGCTPQQYRQRHRRHGASAKPAIPPNRTPA